MLSVTAFSSIRFNVSSQNSSNGKYSEAYSRFSVDDVFFCQVT